MSESFFYTHSQTQLADTLTPVGLYLRLRDRYPRAILLESSDYHARELSFSYICLEPMAEFILDQGTVVEKLRGREESRQPAEKVPQALEAFMAKYRPAGASSHNGFFGYTAYDAIPHFEQIAFHPEKQTDPIPQMQYALFRYVIVFHHYHDTLTLLENVPQGESGTLQQLSGLLRGPVNTGFGFQLEGAEKAHTSEAEYLAMVQKGKDACQAGEVFQIVLSRRFSQGFTGDDFQVYRALRTINPSPYLYYFDYGDFRLMGSSPEAQVISDGKLAEIHPIAGTFRRTGNDAEDSESAARLAEDPKENAEHIMLVDLARNDLARTGKQVRVDRFRELQFFSHVIHLVSRVVANIELGTNPVELLGNTFPAGTLSGAPKHRAMTLIDAWETHGRGFYGGAIGMYGLDGQINHAIIIRSFLSRQHRLHFQAGAGIVNGSVPTSELAEVTHKLAALRRALQKAILL